MFQKLKQAMLLQGALGASLHLRELLALNRVQLVIVTALAWTALVVMFGGFSHVDAIRSGRESEFTVRFVIYALGFAPWLFLGPAVFYVARRLSARPRSKRAEFGEVAVMFAAAFGVVVTYFLAIYAPITGMSAAEAVSSTRLVDWAPDVFIFLIVYLIGRNATEVTEKKAHTSDARIAVRSQKRIDYVKISDIICGSSNGNYVSLYTDDGEYLYRGSLAALIEQLEGFGLMRTHRSHFVRPHSIASAKLSGGRVKEVMLSNGVAIPVSARYDGEVGASLSQLATLSD